MPQKIKYPIINGLKECGKCHEMLPLEQYCKARNHYSALCRKCKNEWGRDYRKRPEVKAATLEYSRRYRDDPNNRERINERIRIYRKKPSAKAVKNTTRRAWTLKEKQKAIDYKGGKCCVCGYNRCAAALDFHHKDPSEKNGYGTGTLKAHWSFEKNKPELDKCVLLCVRCHRELHAGVISL